MAVDKLSKGEGNGVVEESWRREGSQKLVCYLFCTQFNVGRAIKCIKGGKYS